VRKDGQGAKPGAVCEPTTRYPGPVWRSILEMKGRILQEKLNGPGRVRTPVAAVALCVVFPLVGCRGLTSAGGSAKGPIQCGGRARAQLNCEAEFKYEGRNIQGGFTGLGVGNVQAKTEEIALRQIDKETEQYVAQAWRLCNEYNVCVLDKGTYSTRSASLRRRMNKVPELFEGVKRATDPVERRKALAEAYHELVPVESRRELSLDFAMRAKKPGQDAAALVLPGASLPTNTSVTFSLKLSRAAHVYLFQKSPNGTLNVLFPNPRIDTANPVAAGSELQIPPRGASFYLDDRDIGNERVYLVASLEPLTSLAQATERVAAGHGAEGDLADVTEIPSNSGDCRTRALEFDTGSTQSCVRSRGLELNPGTQASSQVSLRTRTEAADGILVQVFSFEHTPEAAGQDQAQKIPSPKMQ
jgi:Domain of unknown function (DUF4384)